MSLETSDLVELRGPLTAYDSHCFTDMEPNPIGFDSTRKHELSRSNRIKSPFTSP